MVKAAGRGHLPEPTVKSATMSYPKSNNMSASIERTKITKSTSITTLERTQITKLAVLWDSERRTIYAIHPQEKSLRLRLAPSTKQEAKKRDRIRSGHDRTY